MLHKYSSSPEFIWFQYSIGELHPWLQFTSDATLHLNLGHPLLSISTHENRKMIVNISESYITHPQFDYYELANKSYITTPSFKHMNSLLHYMLLKYHDRHNFCFKSPQTFCLLNCSPYFFVTFTWTLTRIQYIYFTNWYLSFACIEKSRIVLLLILIQY
jgi:hypothetical protein